MTSYSAESAEYRVIARAQGVYPDDLKRIVDKVLEVLPPGLKDDPDTDSYALSEAAMSAGHKAATDLEWAEPDGVDIEVVRL